MASQLTGFQRVVLGVTGVLAALRLFFPITRSYSYNPVGDTLMQVLALILLAAVVMFLGPSFAIGIRRLRVAINRVAVVVPIAILLITLRLVFPVQFTPQFYDWQGYIHILNLTWLDRVELTLGVWKKPNKPIFISQPKVLPQATSPALGDPYAHLYPKSTAPVTNQTTTPSFVVPSDWPTTGLHVGLIVFAAVLWGRRIGIRSS